MNNPIVITNGRNTCTLYHADCLDVLPTLTGIDAVISDPPYGMGWDADSRRFSGGRGVDWKPVVGDERPFDPTPWLGFPRVVLFGSNHFAARLPVGSKLIWIKKHDSAFGTFLSDAEEAWMKGGHGIYCKRDTTMTWAGANFEKLHPTQKPVAIMAWVMERAKVPAGATVLDGYMGSGTTGIACIRTGRNFVGIEKDARYFEIARERIEREARQGILL